MKIHVFWNVTLCWWLDILHDLRCPCTLEHLAAFELSRPVYPMTQCNISDLKLEQHCCENLKISQWLHVLKH